MKTKIVSVVVLAILMLPVASFAANDVSTNPDTTLPNYYGSNPTPATDVPGTMTGSPSQPATMTGSPIDPTNTSAAKQNTSAGSNNSNTVTTLSNPLKGVNSISDLIFTFMKIVSYLAVIFGVIMLMWVGLQFVLARGNPEEIKKRSNQLLWVVVGIGVILGARILITVIINTLQSTGTVNPAVIQSAQNAINNQ
ncbi:MAG TPA: pilin [Candidatus Paceibacterota bacterium]|nr:pilin [Candidatus Paceibacterota bacterium]